MGISLLKPLLLKRGIGCDILYLNIRFAELVGLAIYERVCEYQNDGGDTFIGEWLFAKYLFKDRLPSEWRYKSYLERIDGHPIHPLDSILQLKHHVAPFITTCVKSVPWQNYGIIGFASIFEQNIASLALSKQIKSIKPEISIVFGGSNCEEEMGLQLHRCFSWIDYVCYGQADDSFPLLSERILGNQSTDDIPGVIKRKDGQSVMVPSSPEPVDLNDLPYPDYDDYMAQMSQTNFYSPQMLNSLPMETSRGCWWGEKSKCCFCGLGPDSIKFRSKSSQRTLAEIRYLIERYGIAQIQMVDSILDKAYFNSIIPILKETQLPIEIFYEVKANLKKQEVEMLSDARIRYIQPGIENLSTQTLKSIGKGVTALQNIQLLKNCQQAGVYPIWNFIFGFPGEDEKQYIKMLDVIDSIAHLPPPNGNSRFELHRFSTYYSNPQAYGLINIRPKASYTYIYPLPEATVFKIAYYFAFDYEEQALPTEFDSKLDAAIEYWRTCYDRQESLYAFAESASALLIKDGRSCRVVPQLRLVDDAKRIYEFCDQIQPFSAIYDHLYTHYATRSVRRRDVKDFLEQMVRLKLMIMENDKYLNLAITVNASPMAS